MSATAIILAAGASSRMGGRPKALLELHGATFLTRIVGLARAAGVDDVVVVAGPPHGDEVKARLPADVRLGWNPDPSRGMLSSVQVGIAEVPARATSALVWPVDLPVVRISTVQSVLQGPQGRIVVPRHERRGGHPVRLPRSCFEGIRALPPTSTLRDFIDAHGAEVVIAVVDDPGCVADVDTPEAYRALLGDADG